MRRKSVLSQRKRSFFQKSAWPGQNQGYDAPIMGSAKKKSQRSKSDQRKNRRGERKKESAQKIPLPTRRKKGVLGRRERPWAPSFITISFVGGLVALVLAILYPKLSQLLSPQPASKTSPPSATNQMATNQIPSLSTNSSSTTGVPPTTLSGTSQPSSSATNRGTLTPSAGSSTNLPTQRESKAP